MRELSVFTRFIAPHVIGCPDPLIEEHALTACIEFAEETCIVQQTTVDAAVADLSEYDVEEPSMLELTRVLRVFHRRRLLKARSASEITDAAAASGETIVGEVVASGAPAEWFMRDPAQATVSIYPPPELSEDHAVTIVSAMQPTRDATRVPDDLYFSYARDIAAGATALLMMMPQQPWSNPQLAVVHRSTFNNAKARAAAMARTGFGAGSLRVRPRSFV